MWRLLTPYFEDRYRLITFDHMGLGNSDQSRTTRPATSGSTVTPTTCSGSSAELDLHDVVFVGHSVSSMIGVLAAVREPERFASLVLVCPSPCYVNDEGYAGGFTRQDIDELLESLDAQLLGWSAAMAPGRSSVKARSPRAGWGALAELFCRADPGVAGPLRPGDVLGRQPTATSHGVGWPTLDPPVPRGVIAQSIRVGEYIQRAISDSPPPWSSTRPATVRTCRRRRSPQPPSRPTSTHRRPLPDIGC